jgi:hypothetical protein
MGVVVCVGGSSGPDGVRENRGAGAAWSTPLACTSVDRARRCSFCEASVQVSTGVTHASVPAKISVHSSRVLPANFSANSFCTSGKADASSWFGTSSDDNPRPASSCAKNCGSIASVKLASRPYLLYCGRNRLTVSNGEYDFRRAPLHDLMHYEGRQIIEQVRVIDTQDNPGGRGCRSQRLNHSPQQLKGVGDTRRCPCGEGSERNFARRRCAHGPAGFASL